MCPVLVTIPISPFSQGSVSLLRNRSVTKNITGIIFKTIIITPPPKNIAL